MTTINLPENKYDALSITNDRKEIEFCRPDHDGEIEIDCIENRLSMVRIFITKSQAKQLAEYLLAQSQD